MTYRYYVAYQCGSGFGFHFVVRDEPIDSEDAIRDVHATIEKELGSRIVILNWKRID